MWTFFACVERFLDKGKDSHLQKGSLIKEKIQLCGKFPRLRKKSICTDRVQVVNIEFNELRKFIMNGVVDLQKLKGNILLLLLVLQYYTLVKSF